MNINVMLVDDEDIDLEWLRRRVVSNRLPSLKVAGTAKSGFTALEMMEQERIDIILSDIRMPIMTGMEFARKAKAINPHVHIIFISGHQDFSYAKEAIHLSASGYLLKPVDDDELHEMLTMLCSKIETERKQDLSLTETLNLVNQELLLRWFNEMTPGPIEEHVTDFLAPLLHHGSVVSLIEIDDLAWKIKTMEEDDRRSTTTDVSNFVRHFADKKHLGYVISSYDFHFVLISTLQKEHLFILLNDLIQAFSQRFPFTLTIGMGMHTTEMNKLHDSYHQAQAALSIKWILGKNRLIRDASEWLPTEKMESQLEEIVEQMLRAMLEYDLMTIDDCLQMLFQGNAPLYQKNDVYDLIIRITSKLHAELRQMNENLYEIVKWDSHEPQILFQFETVHDIVSWLRKRFFELSELLYVKKQGQKRKLIDEITDYVSSKLEQKITLIEVAAHFGFSPNYLGQLFKTETNILFSDFLNQLRMKRVCELLLDPTLKIYEIAERVGYKNMIYFNRQFKQSMGMSPGEYRKKNKV
ncbi:response regulator [Paenibacillus azoreducens]|uniref:response regulator transcription factor n=1 Tax=Paenibacillus azoreducens TaxID=116718 RepID=UPI0039F55DFD